MWLDLTTPPPSLIVHTSEGSCTALQILNKANLRWCESVFESLVHIFVTFFWQDTLSASDSTCVDMLSCRTYKLADCVILEVGAFQQPHHHIHTLTFSLCFIVNCDLWSTLCVFLDKNVEVIYVCPRHLGDDIVHYYTSLLKCDGATEGADAGATQASSCMRRFIILTPEAVDFFPVRSITFPFCAHIYFKEWLFSAGSWN